MRWTYGRAFLTMTAVVAWVALVLQLVLVVDGAAVLVEQDPPGLWLRVGRYFSYFTIQSNILVAVSASWLGARPDADTRVVRASRAAGLIGIAITGLVHFFLLRPLLDLDGWNQVADTLLHVVVPILTVVGWLAVGPRGRMDRGAIASAFGWPVVWLAWTLAVGAATGWFPYPFLNWSEAGGLSVALTCVAIFALAAGLFALAAWLDRRLPDHPASVKDA